MQKNKSYEEFVEKFKPKKTTDDCYTPPEVYAVVRDWACEKYGIDREKIVRPFYPGGDYERYDYPEGAVVVDNPPFSILTKICAFYLERKIPFFLFAPSLTCFSGKQCFYRVDHIVCDCDIEYENGAIVRTSFVTSYGGDVVAETAPDLTEMVNRTVERLRREKRGQMPKYSYPDHVVTSAMMQKYAKYGVKLVIRRGECCRISKMDAQKPEGKGIFGHGLLLSERAAAEKAAAEKTAAEKAAAERAAARVWALSEREWKTVREMTEKER